VSIPELRNYPQAAQVLSDGGDILDSIGAHWWLSSGTALGIYRDGRLIPHDNDLDVGVLDTPELRGRLVAALRRAGADVFVEQLCQVACRLRDVVFDVRIFYRVEDELVTDTELGQMRKPARLVADLARIEFDGRSYPLPNPPDEYLAVRYGPGWPIPKTSKGPWTHEAHNLIRR
jgi:hypothetical protein